MQVDTSNRKFYDRISEAYDAIADSNEHRVREMGEQALGLRAGESVLEIGYGTGNSLIHLARSVGETGRVCGYDVSSGMAKVASEKLAIAGLSGRAELREGDASVDIPWPDDTFSAAFMSFTLELFGEDERCRVLESVRRVLKPGGRLGVVAMANVRSNERESALEATYKWMHRHFPHIVDCEPIDVVGALANAGFRTINEQRLEIWTMPVACVVAVLGPDAS